MLLWENDDKMLSCDKMVSLELGHTLVIQKIIERQRIESKEIVLNTFNWTIAKLGHKLMVNYKLKSYVTHISLYSNPTNYIMFYVLYLSPITEPPCFWYFIYWNFSKTHQRPINNKITNVAPKYLPYGWNLGWLVFTAYFICGKKC